MMLLRSGVGHLRLVDFDQVTLSSLNRHATATREDVGRSKVLSMKAAFARIMPSALVDARVQLFSRDAADELLSGRQSYWRR